jgi:hypothetical protein
MFGLGRKDEIKSKFKTNVVKQRKFSDLLQASLGKYANRAIEAAQVIEEQPSISRNSFKISSSE